MAHVDSDSNGADRRRGPAGTGSAGPGSDAYVEQVVLRLLIRFGDQLPRSDLEYLVRQASAGFIDARIHAFVPILIEHQAADWVHTILHQRSQGGSDLGAVG